MVEVGTVNARLFPLELALRYHKVCDSMTGTETALVQVTEVPAGTRVVATTVCLHDDPQETPVVVENHLDQAVVIKQGM